MPDEAAIASPSDSSPAAAASPQASPGWFQCLSGGAIAAGFGALGYALTTQIATNFAAHPFTSRNFIAVRISAAVRTLVIGSCSLATAVFAFAALGLVALGIQTAIQQLRSAPSLDRAPD